MQHPEANPEPFSSKPKAYRIGLIPDRVMNALTHLTDVILPLHALVVAVGLALILFIGTRVFARTQSGENSLEITQLYCYPIKSLRGCALQKAHLGHYGLVGDRTFSLQRVHEDQADKGKKSYETLLVGYYLQLSLFQASIEFAGELENAVTGEVVVNWHGQGTEFDRPSIESNQDDTDEIRFPLRPSTEGREQFEIELHKSRAVAYDMGDKISSWFTKRLGFETRLVYIGDRSRPVLGSLAPNSPAGLKKARLQDKVRSLVPWFSLPAERLVFNDLAHYLIVTEESNAQVSSRLEGNYTMDVRKFRPNIVVKGASGPFVEDFWGELTFDGGIRMALTANCYRCQSITVDFDTGRTATDDRGMVWKKLNKDRRVDSGAKYSPVFGRYGFCFGNAVHQKLIIGQKVSVTRVNASRTTFDWPHLTTFGISSKAK
ncbi:Mitochondrial amidoxime-reducing component 1 [Paramyrothecium foliicola]|nr:Mitochondrial amidoxime-reducing component 1 [Paramyrothecium foliicola]